MDEPANHFEQKRYSEVNTSTYTMSVSHHSTSSKMTARTPKIDIDTTLVEKMNLLDKKRKPPNSFRVLDKRRKAIYDKLRVQLNAPPKSIRTVEDEKKPPIERRLLSNQKRLEELSKLGEDLMKNIKIENEREELLRREFEETRGKELRKNLQQETIEAMALFQNMTSKWSELSQLDEPVAMYEALEDQKERIAEVMKLKDDIIERCEKEIARTNEAFNQQQIQKSNDIQCLADRISNQIDLMTNASKAHLDLLYDSIDEERRIIALDAARKWHEFYDDMLKTESDKFDLVREKEEFYKKELERIRAEQAELTRATRIRLDKEAEQLEFDLAQIRSGIFMQSEKQDYNDQVLQKRNDENIIMNNNQKRRVGKLNRRTFQLKNKIKETVIKNDTQFRKATDDIKKLQASSKELERKAYEIKKNNDVKFNKIWLVNIQEMKDLLERVFDTDRILHEQQLHMPWSKPEVDFQGLDVEFEKPTTSSYRRASKFSSKPFKKFENKDEKLAEMRLLRTILRHVSDRAGVLVEKQLLQLLEPYNEKEQRLVRIENIFRALRIEDMNMVKVLSDSFKPHAWCENCSEGPAADHLKSLFKPAPGESKANPTSSNTRSIPTNSKTTLKQTGKPCENHFLVIEPASVFTVLNEFIKRHEKIAKEENVKNKTVGPAALDVKDIQEYWASFLNYMPDKKQKIWKATEHGLHHYLDVLKRRIELDKEVDELRRGNAELKHLLKNYGV